MPFTPFHFGPGAMLAALAHRHISFTVFAFTQVLIDVEPAFFWLYRGEPVHPYLHTYLGALPVAVVGALLGPPVCEWALRLWNSRLSPAQAHWLGVAPKISRKQAMLGAFAGAYSHVFIDSFMHDDMRPLAPFADAGKLTGAISIERLQWLCLAAGLVALGVYIWGQVRGAGKRT